ncbi:MAG: DDE-type integrase/transposase/recombinase [Oscillochloridaceae bacterium umkhey_bin13]
MSCDTQRAYELIRPIVLFGQAPTERAAETNTPVHTLRRRAQRFDLLGMSSLFEPAPPEPAPPPPPTLPNALPDYIRQIIIDLNMEHPPLRVNEIATICSIRTGWRPDAKTIKRILATTVIPPRLQRRFPPYHQISDPKARRLAVIHLHLEGWNKQRIAAYLETSRVTVHATLRRWVVEGLAAIYPKSRTPLRPRRKVTLRAMHESRTLQRNPNLGEFRFHAKLKQIGIVLSPRTCGRILARNRALYAALRQEEAAHTPKPMPFAASRRHEYWSVDIRYLDMHQLGGGNIYVISIMDNYSRAILASAVSRKQDLTAFLLVLYAAIRQHGAPHALVSDGGAVFKAQHAQDLYAALGIQKEQIERRQSWQNYLETQFNVMRRLTDWHIEHATSWAAVVQIHAQFVADFNYQAHWAHRQRDDNRHSPAEVLGWVRGRVYDDATLHRVFYTTRFSRVIGRTGYVRFQHWRLYGEGGAAQQRASLWLYAEHLTIAVGEQPLAHYTVQTTTDGTRVAEVIESNVLEPPGEGAQQTVWSTEEDGWQAAIPPATRRVPSLWIGTPDAWFQIILQAPKRPKRPPDQYIQERFAI